MIPLSLSSFLLIYVIGFIGIVYLFWTLHFLRKRRQAFTSKRHRLRCTLCSFEFIDDTATELPRCPRCGSLNERFPFRTL